MIHGLRKEVTMKLQKNVEILRYENKVILANRGNGTWIRISKEVFDLVQEFLKADVNSPDDVIEFSDQEDRNYFMRVIENIKQCYMLVDGERYPEQDISNMIIFEVTNRCNLHCTHCCVAAEADNERESDTGTVKEILEKCIEWRPHFIAISGGEPLFRKDFFEIVQYLRERFNGKIGLCTNGLLITKNNVEFICRNVDQIDISIDGVDEETCSVYRGRGVFAKVIAAIKLLQSEGFTNISLSMVFSDKNEYLEKPFTELNRTLGTKPIYRMLSEKGRAKDNKEILATTDYEESYVPESFINRESSEEIPIGASDCMAGKHSILIRYNGDIYPCPTYISHEEFCMGNIQEVDSIRNIVGKNMSDTIKNNLYKTNKSNGKNCQNCPVKLFCFSCPGDPQRFSTEEAFQNYCNISKPVLMKKVWGI